MNFQVNPAPQNLFGKKKGAKNKKNGGKREKLFPRDEKEHPPPTGDARAESPGHMLTGQLPLAGRLVAALLLGTCFQNAV